MRAVALIALTITVGVAGCATKNNGRVYPVSFYETEAYSCREIALELAKVGAYQQAIVQESAFGWRSVGGFSADLGLGNYLERRDAEAAGEQRRRELEALARQRGCTPGDLVARPTPVPASAHVQSHYAPATYVQPASRYAPAVVYAPSGPDHNAHHVHHAHHAACGHSMAKAAPSAHVHPGRAAADAYHR